MVSDTRVMTMEELAAFLLSSGNVSYRRKRRSETYAWIENTLRRYGYPSRPRQEKGLIRKYLEKMTGYSPAQLSRLIAQYRRTGHVRLPDYQRHRFPANVGSRVSGVKVFTKARKASPLLQTIPVGPRSPTCARLTQKVDLP